MKQVFSSGVFLVNEGHVLLVFHKRYQLWMPVGGKIEPNETPLAAAIREVREETGVVLTPESFPMVLPSAALDGSPPGLLCYDEHPAGEGVMHLNFNFVALAPNRVVVLTDEHLDARWFRLDSPRLEELCASIPNNVRRCLDKLAGVA